MKIFATLNGFQHGFSLNSKYTWQKTSKHWSKCFLRVKGQTLKFQFIVISTQALSTWHQNDQIPLPCKLPTFGLNQPKIDQILDVPHINKQLWGWIESWNIQELTASLSQYFTFFLNSVLLQLLSCEANTRAYSHTLMCRAFFYIIIFFFFFHSISLACYFVWSNIHFFSVRKCLETYVKVRKCNFTGRKMLESRKMWIL